VKLGSFAPNQETPESKSRRAPRDDAPQGHALHFLERLERAHGEALDLALTLYRDSGALAFVISWVEPPPELGRVALSLAADDQGAYIVATRAGKFVTCLGPGMALTDLYVVNHARLMAILKRWHERRASDAAFLALGRENRLNDEFRKIFKKSDRFSREDLQVLAPLRPVLFPFLLDLVIVMGAELSQMSSAFAKQKRPDLLDDKTLRVYFEMVHAVANGFLLFGVDGQRGMEKLLRDPEFVNILGMGCFQAWWRGSPRVATFMLWLLGVLGKTLLPHYERWMQRAEHDAGYFCGLLGALATFARHGASASERQKLCDRARRTLGSRSSWSSRVIDVKAAPTFVDTVVNVCDAPEKYYEQTWLPDTRRLVFNWLQALDPGRPLPWATAADVPAQDAGPVAFAIPQPYLEHPQALLGLFGSVPYLATHDAAHMLPPAATVALYDGPWHRSEAMPLIASDLAFWRPKTRVNPTAKVGRNEPCPCGSGKKYKKCCADKKSE
jgi:hypothetical protein